MIGREDRRQLDAAILAPELTTTARELATTARELVERLRESIARSRVLRAETRDLAAQRDKVPRQARMNSRSSANESGCTP